MDPISDFLLLLVKAFIMLFVIIDPPGNIPVFIAITKDMSEDERRKEFNNAIIVATILLLIFAFLGKLILDVLGISLHSFMIAGGILLLIISFDLLRGRKEEGGREEVGVVPMGTPLLAGPGAITTVMVIIQSYGPIIVFFSIFSAIIATKLILSNSETIYKIMGKKGSEALSRVMGIIVAAIGIEFIGKGIIGLFLKSLM